MRKRLPLLSLALCSLPGLLSAALDTIPITNGDFEADLGSTVGSGVSDYTQTVSSWFEANGEIRGDLLQWEGSGNMVPDADGEVWGLLNVSNLSQTPSNTSGAFYQAIGTNEANFDVYVSLDVGVRGGTLPFAKVDVNLYSGNVTGADGSSLSGLGATLLDTYQITDSVFSAGSTVADAVTVSNIKLNTGTNGIAGQTLWLEFTVENLGNFNQPNQALIDDISVSPLLPDYTALEPGSLIAYYPMEGDLFDYSTAGSIHDGSWISGEAYTVGRIDSQSADLTALNATASIPHVLGETFTLTAWIKTDAIPPAGPQWTDGHGILDGSVAGVTNDIGISLIGSKLAFGVGDPDTTILSTTSINDGSWHHIAVQRDNLTGKLRLFIDGLLEAEASGPIGARVTGAPLTLGSLTSGLGIVDACIDDLRIFNSLLDATSLTALYNNAGDYDGDGHSDFEEHIAATAWADRSESIGSAISQLTAGQSSVTLTVDALATRTYRLKRKTDLSAGQWQNTGIEATPKYHGRLELTDPTPPAGAAFYRADITGRGPAREKRPNIVIIYGDDVGYGDVKAYNPSSRINTPNIDALASQGITFTDGHCMASTCSPSRFSMLTGIFAFRNGVTIIPPTGELSIPESSYTLPDMLKGAGYNTAVVGKWHLGMGNGGSSIQWNDEISPSPLDIGFDYSFILPTTNDRVPSIYMENRRLVNADYIEAVDEITNPGTGTLTVRPMWLDDNDQPINDPVYVSDNSYNAVNIEGSTIHARYSDTVAADRLYDSSMGHDHSFINGIGRIGYFSGGAHALWEDQTQAFVFLEKAREYIAAQDNETPFFLYFASQDIHVPRAPHEAFQGATQGLTGSNWWRGDAMVQFDWTVGQIMQALEDAGLAEDTIVFFSSDNGPVYDDGYVDGSQVIRADEEVDNGHEGNAQWQGGKYSNLEGGTRVPFIVRWPARIEPGIVSDALMNQTDLMATFADLLDQELPTGSARDSRSVLEAFLGNDPVGANWTLQQDRANSRALRMGTFKYDGSSLYDLASDPSESTDLASDSAHEAILNTMAAQYTAAESNSSNRENP